MNWIDQKFGNEEKILEAAWDMFAASRGELSPQECIDRLHVFREHLMPKELKSVAIRWIPVTERLPLPNDGWKPEPLGNSLTHPCSPRFRCSPVVLILACNRVLVGYLSDDGDFKKWEILYSDIGDISHRDVAAWAEIPK